MEEETEIEHDQTVLSVLIVIQGEAKQVIQSRHATHSLRVALISVLLMTGMYGPSSGEANEDSFRIVAGQPVPVRWETAARKLPLKYQPVPPDPTRTNAIELDGLKREGVSFQVSIGPGLDQPARVKDVSLPALRRENGPESIDGSSIELKEVGLVRNRESDREWPDVLFPTGTLPGVSGGYSYTLWNTIYVPADAPPGLYSGTLSIKVEDGKRRRTLQIPVELEVHDYTLPENVPVSTQLFRFNAGSADLWYGFEDREERITYLTEKVYPRYVRNRMSPGRFVPDPKPLYMRQSPYGTGGPHGRFRRFDGSTGEQTEFSIDQTKDFSITLWIRPENGASGNVLAQWGGGAKGMEWRFDPAGKLKLYFSTKQKGRTIDSLAVSVDPEEWSHVAVTVENPGESGTAITVYRNGKRVSHGNIAGLNPSNRKLHLGSAYRTSIRPFSGGLDEVSVYSRVLSKDEIERDRKGSDDPVNSRVFSEEFRGDYGTSSVGKAYLKKWGRYWRSRGLYLNNLPIPRGWNKDRLKSFFERMRPVIRSREWGPYLYIRLPYDEATHGRKAKENRAFAHRLKEVAPTIRRHQTFGGGLRGDAIDNILKPHAGLVDIWCSVPGHYLKQFPEVRNWLYQRRKQHDERLSWYIHRNIAVGNKYKDAYTVMDLRGFFWRMFQENVFMCALWSTTNWDRRTSKHRHRDLERVERGFELTPTTGTQTGNGLLFYPGKSKNDLILDSMRAQIIRDAIEDLQYLTELRNVSDQVDQRRIEKILNRVDQIEERFVRFGPTVELSPDQLLQLRKKITSILAQADK